MEDDTIEQLKRLQDQWNKAEPQRANNGWTFNPPPYNPHGGCPNCGYCQHCGRGGGYYGRPYITCLSDNTAGSLGHGWSVTQ